MDLGINTLLKISYDSIWSNRLRTIITISIIALGIMALVGINIVIGSIKGSITGSFSSLGVGTIQIDTEDKVVVENTRQQYKEKLPFTEQEIDKFRNFYNLPAAISSNYWSKGSVKAQVGEESTDPNIQIIASDEHFLETKDIQIRYGRNFNKNDIRTGASVCMLGAGVANKLFDKTQKALDTLINLDGRPYNVIAVLKEKGSSMSRSFDNSVIVTILNSQTSFPSITPNYYVLLKNKSGYGISGVKDEAISAMRQARGLKPSEENDFNISTNDDLMKSMNENLNYVSTAAMFIGIITLLSAAVSLMNIMLVSVSERTKEVGLQKAIGATSSNIRNQFLTESLLISMIGGLIGISLGILISLLLSSALGTPFTIPWGWVGIGLGVCVVVGLISGIYPAQLASKLQPIEALRYE